MADIVPHAKEILQGPQACTPKVRALMHRLIEQDLEPGPLAKAIAEFWPRKPTAMERRLYPRFLFPPAEPKRRKKKR